MGCGSSSASSPGGDDELDREIAKVGGTCRKGEDPEDDCFEPEDAGEGEQFMAVKPWIGQIAEPAQHNPINNEKPDETFALEYAYGYRCADSRQNCHYNVNEDPVYMTAALGVILDRNNNTQKFFGGGEVENTSKQTANDMNGHTNDVMCIKLCNHKKMAASGQVGS